MTQWDVFTALGVSLGLGLLVGLQRELADSKIAGFRTFALITLLGTICAFVADAFGGWIVAAGLLGVSAASAVGNWLEVRKGAERGPGITTEIAVLVMFMVGALVGMAAVTGADGTLRTGAIAIGVTVAILLEGKKRLHGIAERLGEKDLRAILLFAALTFVVLPLLPSTNYGPPGYEVWNPRVLWLMVVLVVGISLGGYIAYKFAGARAGTVLGGLIGGMISSTAVTLSFARRAGGSAGEESDAEHGRSDRKSKPGRRRGMVGQAALAIALASAVVYVRVLVEIGVAGPSLLRAAAWPLGAMFLAALTACGVLYWLERDGEAQMPAQQNPTELRSALIFGVLFALVLLAVAWAQERFGGAGIYVVALISGIHDMDAITLSNARLATSGEVAIGVAWRAIVLAAISNMAFKAGIAGVFGGRALLWRVLAAFAPPAVVGLLFVLLWPGWGETPAPA